MQSRLAHDAALAAALALPSGARFYRCALQINPYEYLARHSHKTTFRDEASYNRAIVEMCGELGIEVIAITDHYRVKSAENLRVAAEAAGVRVLPGFEAVTKEGVHFLCLFDPSQKLDYLERILGACGIHQEQRGSPVGKHDVEELLRESRGWGAVCIAAHVASQGGLLGTLKGQAAINAWRSKDLLACSLPGPVSDAPANVRPILENKNGDYKRQTPVAVLNGQDVSDPDDLAKPGASCWIKMSEVTSEGLRQAFLDSESRIRLASDPVPEDHIEFVAIAWQGNGFLGDGTAVHFNENLNVLIGGRGAGKSSVVESLRCVLGLDPLGEEAKRGFEGIVRQVLRSGTKISLLVRAHQPSKRHYIIERTVPNPPVVRDESGKVLPITPRDVLAGVEVYGQHELSEIARSPDKRARLLERFVDRDPNLARRNGDLRRELERSRLQVVDVNSGLKQVEDRLASLPALEEMLRRFQEAGLEEKLKEQSLLVREERLLRSASDRVLPFRAILEQLRRELPIDRGFLSGKALDQLPGKTYLATALGVLEKFTTALENVAKQLQRAIEEAEQGLAEVKTGWEQRKRLTQTAYEKTLRELQKSRIDGEEFISLRQQIEDLRPLSERRFALQRDLSELTDRRRNLLAEWEDLVAEEFRQMDKAAKRVSRELAGRVRVQVAFGGNREPLFELLKDHVSGRLAESIKTLRERPDLSLKDLAEAIRSGRDVLAQRFGLQPSQAERIAQAPPDLLMRIEELELPPTAAIELNVAAEGQPAVWQELERLSTGQKATAVLLLLLLESDAPLVVDQPEDDLDNRFITGGIVPKMRQEKRRRQFVFATHNANIPVLGDAELIVGLRASGDADQGRAEVSPEHMGSIDTRAVRDLVEEVLEGGREAFEMRRLKYGF